MNQFLDYRSKSNRLLFHVPPWLVSGILYGLSFPSWETLNLAPLAWFALTFLLIPQVVHQKPVRYVLSALLFGLIGSLIAGYWTMKYSLWLGVVAVFWHALIVVTPLWIFRFLVLFFGYGRSLILLPFIWTAWEWMAASFQPFFWGALGSTQSNLSWIIQFADMTGVWGLSFWLITLNAATAYLWGQISPENNKQIAIKIVLLFVACMLPVVLYGLWRSTHLKPSSSGKMETLIVQPGSAYTEGWNSIKDIMDQTRTKKFDLAIWPESIFTGMPFHNQYFSDAFNQWSAPVMMVFIASQRNPSRMQGFDQYGASIILDQNMLHRLQMGPSTAIQEPHYRKQKLVPYAELQLIPDIVLYFFPILNHFVLERMQHPSQRSQPLTFIRDGRSHRLAPLLCYEAIFPDLSGYAVKNGAEALFVMANDLQFGTAESWQAASFAKIRAVETRRPVVRASTGGVVGVIDIYGQWVFKDSHQQKNGFQISIDLIKEYQTFYVQWIDWFPKFCLTVVFLLISVFILTTPRYKTAHTTFLP